MLTFSNYRIASRKDGEALIYANCVELQMREVYALVPFRSSDSDEHIINSAFKTLSYPDTQARLGAATTTN